MENLNSDIKQKIISHLQQKEYGASSSEIAKYIGHNRVTISKYLEIMKAHGLLEYEDVAPSKLWRVKQDSKKPKVLIVDDEPHVINLVKLSLMSSNFSLHEASSGIEALEKIKQISPELVVLDLMMPGMTGYEVCKQIKENALTQHIQVIMLTAKGELDDKIKGILYNADDYITKPFDPMELEARIQLMLKYKEHVSEKHPITQLPVKGAIMEHLRERMLHEEDFVLYSIVLNNFKEYVEAFGYKRGNEVLLLLSRLLANAVSDQDFIGQTMKNSFVMVSKKQNLDLEIMDTFSKILPYFYESMVIKETMSLNIVKVTRTEIETKKFDHFVPIV
ncbi:response regulator [Candidatus Woesearchaeota archaeon]|nr:response regulator [Candidatus Woesearchaeota archaeon]